MILRLFHILLYKIKNMRILLLLISLLVYSTAICQNIICTEKTTVNQKLIFKANISSDRYKWNFGNNVIKQTTQNKIVFEFDKPGIYEVSCESIYLNRYSRIDKCVVIVLDNFNDDINKKSTNQNNDVFIEMCLDQNFLNID